jgi:hypothetical protein
MTNVISIPEWTAKQRDQRKPVVWSYYGVVTDPTQPHGWKLALIERKPEFELD